MRYLILFSRLFVGSLFIVSGLIKANDPLGFSYKLEEYFAESALNLPFLEPLALFLGALACIAEIVLGFAVLFGGRMKLATWALLLLTLFFGWLTAYTATCDPNDVYTVVINGEPVERGVTCVTDCGCFGDAMKGSIGRSLTPWESFSKDMVLLVFIVPLFLHRKRIDWNSSSDDKMLLPVGLLMVAVWSWIFTWWGPVWFTVIGYLGYLAIKRFIQGPRAEWITAGWIAVLSIVFTWYNYAHLPMRDYRPYAVGKSISEQMKSAKPPVNRTFVSYRNKTTGEVKEYDTTQPYPWDDDNFENVPNSTRIEVIDPGVPSQVQDFRLSDMDGNDITTGVLEESSPVLLVMMYNVEKSDAHCMPAIKTLTEAAYAKGWYVYGVTASDLGKADELRHEMQLPFDFVQCDEKTIKTAIRSNPGVMLLQQGTVRGLWHCNDVPGFDEAAAVLN
ncbi:MAG TPA: DoxX family protein [Flavobacteriales bacterium]|nr:DoxX family protein [Flavobacteriales bacterium]HNU57013.1 DoxX family protein [Flavobacteriales bacterium]